MRRYPPRREGVSRIDKLFRDCWARSKINGSTWRAFPLIPKRFESGPNVKANTINSAWKPIGSQVPTPQHRHRVRTARAPAYSAGRPPSAPAPRFPGDGDPFTALRFSRLQVTNTWIRAPRSTAARERSQHSPPGRAGAGGKKRTKINKPTKFLYTWNGVSELSANYVKQRKNLYSSTTKWSKMMTRRPQRFNQQDKSSLLFLCIFQSMESYCLINPLE